MNQNENICFGSYYPSNLVWCGRCLAEIYFHMNSKNTGIISQRTRQRIPTKGGCEHCHKEVFESGRVER